MSIYLQAVVMRHSEHIYGKLLFSVYLRYLFIDVNRIICPINHIKTAHRVADVEYLTLSCNRPHVVYCCCNIVSCHVVDTEGIKPRDTYKTDMNKGINI